MASIIRIKRSSVSGNPNVLAAGELAYSALTDNGSNGGERLYIGIGTETDGNAANHLVIGGKFFTDKLDHTPGILTASSALIVDSSKKLDELLVDSLSLNDNILSSTGTLKLQAGTTNLIEIADNNVIVGGPFGGSQLNISGSSAYLKQLRSGSVNLVVGANEVATSTMTFNNDGSLTIPGTVKTLSNGDLTLAPNGTGKLVLNNPYIDGTSVSLAEYIYDTVGGAVTAGTGITIANSDGGNTSTVSITNTGVTADTYGSATSIPVITVNAQGQITSATTASISTSLGLAADTGTDTIALGTDTLNISGGEGIDTSINAATNTLTIAAEVATSSNLGVASFNTASFTVTSGDVTIKSGGISNTQLVNSSVTIGSTTVALGATSTSLAGLTELTVDNININSNEISSTGTNQDISLNPSGTGTVAVNGARISGVAAPQNDTDAANKAYVDNAVTGLDWKAAVNLLANTNVALTGSTSTLVIDSHSALDQTDDGVYRILLINQSTSSENGIYVYTDNGTSYTLVRPSDADTYQELIGTSVYVMEGTVYGTTGWVQSNHYLTDFTSQTWVQFSGSGAYVAGAGLTLSGTTFNIAVATDGGIEITDDKLNLKSTVAGAGLTLTSGVLAVGGTADRITVNSDSIDIASTYVGQTSITTLGTIATGTWNATTIGTTKGGTGLSSYTTGDLIYASATDTLSKLAAGIEGKVLQINASGVPVWADLDGGTY